MQLQASQHNNWPVQHHHSTSSAFPATFLDTSFKFIRHILLHLLFKEVEKLEGQTLAVTSATSQLPSR